MYLKNFGTFPMEYLWNCFLLTIRDHQRIVCIYWPNQSHICKENMNKIKKIIHIHLSACGTGTSLQAFNFMFNMQILWNSVCSYHLKTALNSPVVVKLDACIENHLQALTTIHIHSMISRTSKHLQEKFMIIPLLTPFHLVYCCSDLEVECQKYSSLCFAYLFESGWGWLTSWSDEGVNKNKANCRFFINEKLSMMKFVISFICPAHVGGPTLS